MTETERISPVETKQSKHLTQETKDKLMGMFADNVFHNWVEERIKNCNRLTYRLALWFNKEVKARIQVARAIYFDVKEIVQPVVKEGFSFFKNWFQEKQTRGIEVTSPDSVTKEMVTRRVKKTREGFLAEEISGGKVISRAEIDEEGRGKSVTLNYTSDHYRRLGASLKIDNLPLPRTAETVFNLVALSLKKEAEAVSPVRQQITQKQRTFTPTKT